MKANDSGLEMSTTIWKVGCRSAGYLQEQSEVVQMGKGLLVGWLYEPKIPTTFLKTHYIDVINFSKEINANFVE